MKILKSAPYYDDFDEEKKFYRILFKPGYAVQARELTQLQTAIQHQIKRQGDHTFKDGAMVIPGQITYNNRVKYVKLVATTYDVTSFIGLDISNTDGLTARIVHATNAAGEDPALLFVHYTSSVDAQQVFAAADNLTVAGLPLQVDAISAVGDASIVSIEKGVYYVGGVFVAVDAQTITLENYNSTPSYRVGLVVNDQIITTEEDETLQDNAQGSYNYAAPGADRYYMDLVLTKQDLNTPDDTTKFIELLRVDNGKLIKLINRTDYSVLDDMFARRTYDESGDYAVTPFGIDVREYRSNDRGSWASSTTYLIGDVVTSNGRTYVAMSTGVSANPGTSPSHTTGIILDGTSGVYWECNANPYYNRGVYKPTSDSDLTTNNEMESKLVAIMEPGKAYVRGREIDKIAAEYIEIPKARETVSVDNAIIPVDAGNYILVDSVNGIPPINAYTTVNLYNRRVVDGGTAPTTDALIGTARVRFLDWHSGTVYKLGLYDIQLNSPSYDFNRHVKSACKPSSFTANLVLNTTQITGYISGNTAALSGYGTSFLTDLSVNDYIKIGDSFYRVTSITSQTAIDVDRPVSPSGNDAAFYLSTTQLNDTGHLTSIFPMPYYAIKSSSDVSYTVYKTFTGTCSSASSGTCTLSVSTTVDGETFASAANLNQNYIVALTGGALITPNSAAISTDSKNITFTLPGANANSGCTIVAAVNKTGSTNTLKTKTLTAETFTTTEQTVATSSQVSLGQADGYRLVSVYMDTGTFTNPTADYSIDITDRYTFDDGQRDNYYGLCAIKLKPSYQAPSGPIKVNFEYFAHGSGDYFAVGSYTGVSYGNIPTYKGAPLRDMLDFRPRVDANGTSFSVGSNVPKRGANFTTDYEYYLARKTLLSIDASGFKTTDSTSSLSPNTPTTPTMSMPLYLFTLEPYTFTTLPSSVLIKSYDNKRYTMRDIGRLENRISNLEYYSSLTALEQQTESLTIVDSDGLTRFKNGFIVDNFVDHAVGDVSNPDYVCGIDAGAQELRPYFAMNSLNLIESSTTTSSRADKKYVITDGKTISLPYSHESFIDQSVASRVINVNPYAVFAFVGNVSIIPASDTWTATTTLADINFTVDKIASSMAALQVQGYAAGTIWQGWMTTSFTNVQEPYTPGYYTYYEAPQDGTATHDDWLHEILDVGTFHQTGAEVPGYRMRNSVRVGTSTAFNTAENQTSATTTNTIAIPHIRSRKIIIKAKGFKPNTRIYPFFDGVDVGAYVTRAYKISYTPTSGTTVFDATTNYGATTNNSYRKIDTDTYLTTGDVVFCKSGDAIYGSAVVVGTEYDPSAVLGHQHRLLVVLTSGAWTGATSLVGSESGATGTLTAITQQDYITSTNIGDVVFEFTIPNNNQVKFNTGVRELTLTDATTYTGASTSKGRGVYTATGTELQQQKTVTTTKYTTIEQSNVSQTQSVGESYEDPLAQTFLVTDQPGGLFVTKVELFFASKSSTIPVTVELREVINGYPSSRGFLPHSRVTKNAADIMVSSNRVTVNGESTAAYDTPTTFVFDSPVYLENNTEYALVVKSDSTDYQVWISNLGDQIPAINSAAAAAGLVSQQPYLGVLFKSQNASTWTPEQLQDLKFKLYRAKFSKDVIADVEFVNAPVPLQKLESNPFETRLGSNKVRVYQRDHGMPAGSTVSLYNTTIEGTGIISNTAGTPTITGTATTFSTLLSAGDIIYSSTGDYIGTVSVVTNNTSLTVSSNLTGFTSQRFRYAKSSSAASINGIPNTEICGVTHEIGDVDQDSYTILITTPATSSGYGGTEISATRNYQYDLIHPFVDIVNFTDTKVSCGIKTTSGKSPDSTTQVPYGASTSYVPIHINSDNPFFAPQMISSSVNETDHAKTLTLSVKMSTTNDRLSPIIDTERVAAILVNNKINNPLEDNLNVGVLDEVTITVGGVNVDGNQITSTTSPAAAALLTMKVGHYATVTANIGSGSGIVTAVASDGSSVTFDRSLGLGTITDQSITVKQREMFVDEIAPVGGSATSKYISKQISLANDSTFAKIRFAAHIPLGSNVEVYYRTGKLANQIALENVAYNLATPDSTIANAQIGTNQFMDVEYSLNNLEAFDLIQVKIVFKSTNTSAVPRIKDLRIVACA